MFVEGAQSKGKSMENNCCSGYPSFDYGSTLRSRVPMLSREDGGFL